MNESKYKRVVSAITVGIVLLFCFLLYIMISQIISISLAKAESEKYDKLTAQYERLLEDGEKTLEARKTRWWIECKARNLGYVYPDDVVLD